jgi:hypothetical protein
MSATLAYCGSAARSSEAEHGRHAAIAASIKNRVRMTQKYEATASNAVSK